ELDDPRVVVHMFKRMFAPLCSGHGSALFEGGGFGYELVRRLVPDEPGEVIEPGGSDRGPVGHHQYPLGVELGHEVVCGQGLTEPWLGVPQDFCVARGERVECLLYRVLLFWT